MQYLLPLRIVITVLIAIVLVSCGSDDKPTTPPPPTPPPTAEPGQLTVGDLVTQSEAAWSQVHSLRTTSQSGQIPREGDAPPAMTGSVQDWTTDGDRHVIEFRDGVAINEQIYVDGVIYMRGEIVNSAVAPGIGINTWIILNPDVIPEDTPVGRQVSYLTREQSNPFGPLQPETMVTPVREAGRVTVGDRSCTVYSYGDVNNTGTEIRVEIAVADDGLPCQVVQRTEGFQNSTVYEYNLEGVDILAPTDPATPVSGTPEG